MKLDALSTLPDSNLIENEIGKYSLWNELLIKAHKKTQPGAAVLQNKRRGRDSLRGSFGVELGCNAIALPGFKSR